MGTAQSEQFKYSFVGDLAGLRRELKQAQDMFTDLERLLNKGISFGGGNIGTSGAKSSAESLRKVLSDTDTKIVDTHKKGAEKVVDIDKETAKKQEQIVKESVRKRAELDRRYADARNKADALTRAGMVRVSSGVNAATALGIPGTDYKGQGERAIKQLEDYRQQLRIASKEAVIVSMPKAKDNLAMLQKEIADYSKRASKTITDDANARLGMIKQAGEAEVANRRKVEAEKLKAINAAAKEQSRIQKQLATEQDANARRIESVYAKIGRAEADINNVFAKARQRKPTMDWDPKQDIAIANLRSLQNNLMQAQTSYNTARTPENVKGLEAARKAVDHLVSGTRNATNETLKATSSMGLAWGKVGTVLTRIAMWWGTAFALWKTGDLIRQVYNISGAFEYLVKELTAIGDEGEGAYRRLALAGYDAAEQTGRRFEEAAVAMREFVRQGFNAAEINDLVKTTLIGLNITEMGATQLIKSLTAEMRAFNIPARDAITIIDKLMGVSKEYAIDANELAIGIRKFAGVSQQANITLDQQMGIMTAVMERTKQPSESIGTGLRTIIVRLQRNAVDAIENIAKVQVYTDASRQSYRSMWDILNDLAEAWPRMTGAAREEVAFQAAGQRQIEFFIAAMQGWDTAIEATIKSMASAGLAYKTNAQLVDTLQKSVAGLRAEWEKLLASQSGVSNYFRALVDGLRSFLNFSLRIPESVGAIAGAVALVSGGLMVAFGGPMTTLGGIGVGLAGLGATISYVMGKLDSTNVQKVTARYKDLITTQYNTRKATSDLAEMFVSLYKKADTTAGKQKNLKLIQEELSKSNPLLINGAMRLGEVYDILSKKTGELSKATEDASNKRLELMKREAQMEVGTRKRELQALRSKLPTEYQALPLEQMGEKASQAWEAMDKTTEALTRYQDAYKPILALSKSAKVAGFLFTDDDMETIYKAKSALQELIGTYSDYADTQAILRGEKITAIWEIMPGPKGELNQATKGKLFDILNLYNSLSSAATNLNAKNEKLLATEDERKAMSGMLYWATQYYYRDAVKGAEKLFGAENKDADAFQKTAVAMDSLKLAQEDYNAIGQLSKIKGFGEGEPLEFDAESVSKYSSEVNKLIQNLDDQGEMLAKVEYSNKGIEISKENQGLVDKIIFDNTLKGLNAEVARLKVVTDITDREERIKAVKEEIKEFDVGGNREINLRISLLNGVLEVQSSIGDLQKRNNDNLMKGLDKQIDVVEKLYQMQEDYNQAISERRVSAQAEQLKIEERPLEAAGLLLDYATERKTEADKKLKESLKDGLSLGSKLIGGWQKNAARIDMLKSSVEKYKELTAGVPKDKLLTSPKMGEALVQVETAMQRWEEIARDTSGSITQAMVDELPAIMLSASSGLSEIVEGGADIFSAESMAVFKNIKDQLNEAYAKMGGDPTKLKDMQRNISEAGKATQDLVTQQGNYNTALAQSAQKIKELQVEQKEIDRAGAVEVVRIKKGETAALEYDLEALKKEKKAIDDRITAIIQKEAAGGIPSKEASRQIRQLQGKSLEKENEIKKAGNALDAQKLGINKDITKELVNAGIREKEQQIKLDALRHGEIYQLEAMVALRKEELDSYEKSLLMKYPNQSLETIYAQYRETKQEQIKYRGNIDVAEFDLKTGRLNQLQDIRDQQFQEAIDRKKQEQEVQLVGMEYQIGELGVLELKKNQEEELFDIYAAQLDVQLLMGNNRVDYEKALIAYKEQQNRVEQANLALKQAQINAEQELLNLVIQTGAAQIASMIRGDFTASGMFGAIASVGAAATAPINPALSGGIAAAGMILSAVIDKFSAPAEDLSESLDQNRISIDRNTSALRDVTEKFISTPSTFSYPAFMRAGGIPQYANGTNYIPQNGLVYVHKGEKIIPANNHTMGPITIIINGTNDVEKTADAVQAKLESAWSRDRRRGFQTARI